MISAPRVCKASSKNYQELTDASIVELVLPDCDQGLIKIDHFFSAVKAKVLGPKLMTQSHSLCPLAPLCLLRQHELQYVFLYSHLLLARGQLTILHASLQLNPSTKLWSFSPYRHCGALRALETPEGLENRGVRGLGPNHGVSLCPM